jgi:hypothetical protein
LGFPVVKNLFVCFSKKQSPKGYSPSLLKQIFRLNRCLLIVEGMTDKEKTRRVGKFHALSKFFFVLFSRDRSNTLSGFKRKEIWQNPGFIGFFLYWFLPFCC